MSNEATGADMPALMASVQQTGKLTIKATAQGAAPVLDRKAHAEMDDKQVYALVRLAIRGDGASIVRLGTDASLRDRVKLILVNDEVLLAQFVQMAEQIRSFMERVASN
jgi:hypothetical protein